MECLPPLPVPSSSYPPLLSPCGFSSGSSAGQQLEADICQSFLLESIRDWTVNRFGTNSLPGIRKHSRFHLLHRGCGLLSFFLIFLVFVLWSASVQAKYKNVEFIDEPLSPPPLEIIVGNDLSGRDFMGKTHLGWSNVQPRRTFKHPYFGKLSYRTIVSDANTRGLLIASTTAQLCHRAVGTVLNKSGIVHELRSSGKSAVVVRSNPKPWSYRKANDFVEGLTDAKTMTWRLYPQNIHMQNVKIDTEQSFRLEVLVASSHTERFYFKSNGRVGVIEATLRHMEPGSSYFLFSEEQCADIQEIQRGSFVAIAKRVDSLGKVCGKEIEYPVNYDYCDVSASRIPPYLIGDSMVVGGFARLRIPGY
eukprot:GHVS01022986.1.p1 GENE.GHVS01022986.1~~GHVS01022986.1.p1  ORF type:complete len:363 (-),score=14.09 GHVS01022986.1:299-1387(-)